MSHEIIETIEDIQYYGRIWGEHKELDSRYTPPPLVDDMRVLGAAAKQIPKTNKAKEDEMSALTTFRQKKSKSSNSGTQQHKKQESKDSSIRPTSPKQTYRKTTAGTASISDADLNKLAGRLMALPRSSEIVVAGFPSAALPWPPCQNTPDVDG